MPSLNLAPTLSFEPKFRMFIINSCDKKSKRLLVLKLLVLVLSWLQLTEVRFFIHGYCQRNSTTVCQLNTFKKAFLTWKLKKSVGYDISFDVVGNCFGKLMIHYSISSISLEGGRIS